jgi:hypothetical protein
MGEWARLLEVIDKEKAADAEVPLHDTERGEKSQRIQTKDTSSHADMLPDRRPRVTIECRHRDSAAISGPTSVTLLAPADAAPVGLGSLLYSG